MDPTEPPSLLPTVLCFGVGGSMLALVGLWMELRLRPQSTCRPAGVLGLAFAALAAVLALAHQPTGLTKSSNRAPAAAAQAVIPLCEIDAKAAGSWRGGGRGI